jgi:uncharacterized protein YyaL (SSP411 family)
VFLTPEGKPFFAGTYFPPTARYPMPGFKDILLHIAELWAKDRDKVMQAADGLADAAGQIGRLVPDPAGVAADIVTRSADQLAEAFDAETGGMLSGSTNKFPPSMAMSLLLRAYHASVQGGEPQERWLKPVELTLDRMARGGIYDHLGGGIARYSTDPDWLVPHFEKMLYDQAMVSDVYIEAYEVTGNAQWAAVARDIFDYVLQDLRLPEGGFFSSRDADSEEVEGKFYVWSKDEVMAVLGEKAGELFCKSYDVTDRGNWEGHNILNMPRSLEVTAEATGVGFDELRQSLSASREKLLAVRAKRVAPGLDDKVLTAWNGLMIASLAYGGRVLDEQKYVGAARQAADFVLTKMVDGRGRLLRSYRKDVAHIDAYLDDYAFLVAGLIELYQATFDARWLREAIRLNDVMIRHFHDTQDGGFYFTADDGEVLFVRNRDHQDGAIPAGNSVAVMNLLRLADMTGRQELRSMAEESITSVAGYLNQTPFGHEKLLAAVAYRESETTQVVFSGPLDTEAMRRLVEVTTGIFDPHRTMVHVDPARPDAAEWERLVAVVKNRLPIDQKPTAYVCRGKTCGLGATTPAELRRQLTGNFLLPGENRPNGPTN